MRRTIFLFLPCLLTIITSDDVIHVPGDVMLASLFDINDASNDGGCGDYDLNSLRNAYAVQWFVDTLNQRNYTPGITIGLETRRLCNSHARAVRAASNLLDSYVTNTSAPPLAGIIGPTHTQPAVAVSQLFSSHPLDQSVPQISGSATGSELSDKTKYSNFFRVIPPDGAQIQVIRKLLEEIRWNYIAVVYTDEGSSRTMATSLRQDLRSHSICVPIFASIPLDTSGLDFNQAVQTIVDRLSSNPMAGVSSVVRGIVFIGGPTQAQQFANKLDSSATFVEIIFTEALELQSSALKKQNRIIGVAKGALTITPLYKKVTEFQQAWNNLFTDCNTRPQQVQNHAWLNDLWTQTPDCSNLMIGNNEDILHTWYHIQAAAMFMASIKSLLCGQTPGVCSTPLEDIKNYDDVENVWKSGVNLETEFSDVVSSFQGFQNVSFDERGEVTTSNTVESYEVYNFRTCVNNNAEFCFVKVGTYSGGSVTLNQNLMIGHDSNGNLQPWKDMAPAQCDANTDCMECFHIKPCDSTYIIPGDFYFVAVAPVHSRDPTDALECGDARSTLGADFVQAIEFALEQVNKEGGTWKERTGKILGAIIIDSCYSSLVVKNKLLQLHKGRILTPTGFLNETYVQNVLLKRIAGYIGGFFSLISFAMSDILTNLDRKAYVHLSPTSVAAGLSDRNLHPYFMRLTVPSNSEILAMLDLLNKLSSVYVQIIYDPFDAYSAGLTKEFEDRAPEYGVCVAQTIEAPLADDPSHYEGILTQLRQKGSARMVIVILQYQQILDVMNVLIGDGQTLRYDDDFVFLGSEAWARRQGIIEGKQRLAGSLTVAEEIAVDPQFTNYFREVDPVTSNNFWLPDFWEAKKSCYFDRSFMRQGKPSECPRNVQSDYIQDPWVSYYIQAVYAFASGVGKALSMTCPNDSTEICSSLTSKFLVGEMKQVKLDLFSRGVEEKVFDDNGDGQNGYSLNQAFWDASSSSMRYRQIGTWNSGGRLSLSVSVSDLYTKLPADIKTKNFNSSCSNDFECKSCPVTPEEITANEESTVPQAALIAVIILLVVCIVVSAVIIVCLCRKRQTQGQSDQEGLSTLSSGSNWPVQEHYGPSSQQMSHSFHHGENSGEHEDYASLKNTPEPARAPIPCNIRTNADDDPKKDYLTVIATPPATPSPIAVSASDQVHENIIA